MALSILFMTVAAFASPGVNDATFWPHLAISILYLPSVVWVWRQQSRSG